VIVKDKRRIVEEVEYKGFLLQRHFREEDGGYWAIVSKKKNEGENGAYATIEVAKKIIDSYLNS
jgi:hypothetical protein